MLTNKEKKFLKKEAHSLKPLFQIGKNGLNPELVKQLDDLLEKRELIKVNILQNSDEDIKSAGQILSQELSAELIQTIGRVMTLYRPAKDNKHQKISSALRQEVKD